MKRGRSAYLHHGCRCDTCTRANSLYTAQRRERLRGTIAADDERHGKASTYQQYGCRCPPCTDAQAAVMRAHRRAS